MSFKQWLRRLVCCATLAAAGVLAATAAGPGLGAISLTTVSVPTVSVSVPTVTVPTLPPPPPLPPPPLPPPPLPPPPLPPPPLPPPPPPPAPVTVPKLLPPPPPPAPGTPALPVSSPTGSSPTGGASPAGAAGATGTSAPAQAFGGAPASAGPTTYAAGRSGAAGSSRSPYYGATVFVPHRGHVIRLNARHRTTKLKFRVHRPGVVRIVVRRIGCGEPSVTSFRVHAHRGLNTLRLGRRIHGRTLGDGAYRISGRSHGRTVLRAILIVGRGLVYSCSATPTTQFASVVGFAPNFATGGGSSTGAATASTPPSAASGVPKRESGVLGADASKVLPESGGSQIGLVLVLGAAILLLALAAVPRELVPHPAAAAFLARQRALIAGVGLAALLGLLISYFVN